MITEVTIEDFKCFVGKHGLTMPSGPGLVLVRGANEDQPRLGANGVGKSSLFDAITWCLYGKTARGLKSTAVKPWAGGKPSVRVRVREGLSIQRSSRPNEIRVTSATGKEGGRVVLQEAVDALVGMDYTAWLHTCLMSQFGAVFFDLSPTDKLNLLTDVLDLSVWISAAELAKEQAREHDRLMADAQHEQARADGVYRERASGAFNAERVYRAIGDPPAPQDPTTNVESLIKSASAAKASAAKARHRINEAERRMSPLDKEIRKLDREIARLGGERDACQRDIASMRDQYKAAGKMSGKCRICKRPIDAKTTTNIKSDLKDQADFVRAESEKIDKVLEGRRAERAGLSEKLQALDDEIVAKRKQWQASTQQHADLMSQINEASRQQTAIEQHEREVEGATAELTTKVRRAQKARRNTLAWQCLVEAHDADSAACKYWQDKFKHVRLWVVDRALAQLEMEINAALITLGLEGWSVLLHVERETKAKTVAKGFHVSIKSPHNGADVPWEAWSGGETQRLRIAGAAGMAALMSDRLGIEVPIEVWDEPTAHLSGEGVDDVIRFLRGRADDGRQVWVIDHRSLDAGEFDHLVTVTKTNETSTIIME